MHSGTRSNVYHVVCLANGFFIVLHHNHGVTQVAQMGQSAKQSFIVSLVQANRGFIEDIHDADQAGSNLTGQANALRLAARQTISAAIESEIVEANVNQKFQSGLNLFQNLVCYLFTLACELEFLKVIQSVFDRILCDFVQRCFIDKHMPRCFT